MKAIIALLIFCLILFIYLHIYFHLKVSNDLEVYEIERPSKEKLEEICDLRQPVIFDFHNQRLNEDCSLPNLIQNYGAFDIHMRNKDNIDEHSELYLPFTLNAANEIFKKDDKQRYFSENNNDFLTETGIIKNFRYNDIFLRPYMISTCIYDTLISSPNTYTPLRYDVNYRNYFLNTGGDVIIKLIPPQYSKYLYVDSDYIYFEFKSKVDPWNVQSMYKADFDKVKSLEITLKKGQIIFIPAYWLYSIKFTNLSSICVFKYQTYMNVVAISNHLFMNFLQRNNIKREKYKKIHINEEKNQSIIIEPNSIEENNNNEITNQSENNEFSTDQLLPKTDL